MMSWDAKITVSVCHCHKVISLSIPMNFDMTLKTVFFILIKHFNRKIGINLSKPAGKCLVTHNIGNIRAITESVCSFGISSENVIISGYSLRKIFSYVIYS